MSRLNFEIYLCWHANKVSIACDSSALPSKWPGVAFDSGWGPQDFFDKHFGKVILILKSDLVNWVNWVNCSVHFVLLIQGFIYYSAAVPMHQSNYVKERMNEKNVRGNRAQVAWFVLIDLLFVLIAWFVSIVVANCRWWIDGQEERLLQQVERPRLHQLSINQPIHPSHPSIQSIKSINQPTNSINH